MSGLLPSRHDLKNMIAGAIGPADALIEKLRRADAPMFAPGYLLRSDGLPVDETLAGLRERALDPKTSQTARQQLHALHQRTASVSDLTENLYAAMAAEHNSIMSWFPALASAVHDADTSFELPATSIWRAPIEIAQYLRLSYEQTNQTSREQVNAIVADALRLDTRLDEHGRTRDYFLKTGTFSSKFEFANARCGEAHEAGEYFHVIGNLAMAVGAGCTVDLCAREYIEPEPGTPSIYHGMPLRTEMRAFVDLGAPDDEAGTPQLLGITPYWHPSVMTRALALAEREPDFGHIRGDYDTYRAHEPALRAEFDAALDDVAAELEALLEPMRAAGMRGAWSVDVMLTGDRRHIIDMSLMATSALTELLTVTDEYTFASPAQISALADELVWTTTNREHFPVRAALPRLGDSTVGAWPVTSTATPAYRYNWDEPVRTALP